MDGKGHIALCLPVALKNLFNFAFAEREHYVHVIKRQTDSTHIIA